MAERYFRNLEEYLSDRGIALVNSLSNCICEENASEQEIMKHFHTIFEFHKRTIGFSSYAAFRLENYTGKKVEQYKVHLKKFKRDLNKLEVEGYSNDFEKILLEKGPEVSDRAEQCINSIYMSSYYELIERSMKRVEICIGNSGFDNLISKDVLEVIDIKKCGYNLVECDAAYYLSKLRKKGVNLDWKQAIKYYCELEELDCRSEMFIAALISFPIEFFKCWQRYRYGKKDWNENQYENKLIKAMNRDGESLL